VGLKTNDFTQVYNCTHGVTLSFGEIFAIVIGVIVGILLIVFLVILILYTLNKLPTKTKLWIDRIRQKEAATVYSDEEEKQMIQDSSKDLLKKSDVSNSY
jgi:membrane protein insertase Oxa1/YidC/SpoIIIJ